MTTPDYLDQVVLSGKKSATRGAGSAWRPTAASAVWAGLDMLTVLISGFIVFHLGPRGATLESAFILGRVVNVGPFVSSFYLLIFSALLVLCSRRYGLYKTGLNYSVLHEQRLTVQSIMTATLLLCGGLYLFHGYLVSRFSLLLTVVLSLALLMIRRAIWRKVIHKRHREGLETRNVLIVGNGRVGQALRNHLEALRHLGFRFSGFITLAPDASSDDLEVIADVTNCVSVARSLFVDEIYFSTPADKEIVMSVVEEARALGIEVRVVPDLYDGLAWNAPVEYIGQFPTIPLHRREFTRGAFILKRVIDVTVSAIALLVLSPVMATIALAVRNDSAGPIFYRAKRVGRKGRTFSCFKFRTMVANADKLKEQLAHMNERDSVLFKISNDPRITKVGAFLRKYSLDELPQFFNVLRGDMSLVGPRPPIISEVEKYELAHLRRLDVLPGITGLWQVEARQDPSFDNYISLDTAYVENWNIMLDLRILARTVGVVLSGSGT